jgi:hypothetical protein
MRIMIPLRKGGVLVRQLGEESMLYDSEKGTIHILNPTAEFIWNLCDGNHDVEAMEQELRNAFDIPQGRDLVKDIEGILEAFNEKELLATNGR